MQRILRHAKPRVTKERYIKAFDPAVLEAMQDAGRGGLAGFMAILVNRQAGN